MPTYEYSCKSCGEHLEVVQSFKDDALTECPKCGGNLRKVFGNIGIAFKGSGFYRNDSRQGHSSVKPAATESTTGSEAVASISGGEATKPAANGTAPDKTASPAAPAASPVSAPKSTSSSSSAAAAS
jgi:putative FmdB family regulatory protein